MTNVLPMEHARPTITVYVLLLSFIALKGFLAVAERDTAVHDHTTSVPQNVEELPTKTSNKKWHRGRVMAMAAEAREERSTMKAGADPSVRKCGRGEDEKSSLGCELRHKIHPSKLHFSGLMPFTSDYSKPKKSSSKEQLKRRPEPSTRDAKTSLSESLRLSNTKVSSSSSTPNLQSTRNKAIVEQSKSQEATEASSNHAFLRSWRKSQPSGFRRPHDFIQTNPEKQNLLAGKFYKMVKNDYNLRARRHPPVHN